METTPDDFRILPLRRDRDAYLLIGLALVIGVLVVVGLAFLPDAAWERLEERSKLLYGALVAVVPVLVLAWQRYRLRRDAVLGLGQAASAPIMLDGGPILGEIESTAANPQPGTVLGVPGEGS